MNVSGEVSIVSAQSALIVDDAFDIVPLAADLKMDGDAWSIFIADIGEDIEHIEAAFPSYKGTNANDLRDSDEFVKVLYGLKEKLRPQLWETLFEAYERDTASDRVFLENLCNRLTATGLNVKKSGRNIPDDACECQIIFADLFLGAAQQDFDVTSSIDRIKKLIAGRESRPPAVVLMSRSPLLKDKKEKFRDETKLIGALFRVYRKQDLLEGATVETVIERLATHHADAVRVAAFLAALEVGLTSAVLEFMKVIRRLDLSDYCKIREVLLEAEGQPLGSYMLDVFDRVLQHEIEGDSSTIRAAQELSTINFSNYPAPYIAGSPDLQDLVARSVWQNPERLKLAANTSGMPVSFGDVLVHQSWLDLSLKDRGTEGQPDVFVVLTPACDLARKSGKRRVLLVGGKLNPVDSKNWKYKTKGAHTPIVQLTGQSRMSVEWDLDEQLMLTHEELDSLVAEKGSYAVRCRLRENYALELQQSMLANMGRIGLLSKMPFTFPIEVSMFTIDADEVVKALDLPITAADGGVCITGRDENGEDLTRLILTEASIDEILSAIPKIESQQIHLRARDTLKKLQASLSFRSMLQRGLEVPKAGERGKLKQLKVQAHQLVDGKPVDEIVGLIARNPEELRPTSNEQKSGALIIVLRDVDREPQLAEACTGHGDDSIVDTKEVFA